MRLFFALCLISSLTSIAVLAEPADETESSLPADVVSGQVLNGSWVRPDGGYILMVRKVLENGTLQASYLNPRSIRVASARWRIGGSSLQIRVDLNDTGYEGAYYLLRYNPVSGRLEGEYHPANQGVFEVAFERQLGPVAR
ncbi:MAG: hypothetical protein SynsKO_43380 [Synoicihabitans sp.]